MEQKLYSINGDILIQKNRCEDGHVWILGPRSFKLHVIIFFECKHPLLTNDFDKPIVLVLSVVVVKIKPNDNNIFVMLLIYLTHHFSYGTRISKPVLVFVLIKSLITRHR